VSWRFIGAKVRAYKGSSHARILVVRNIDFVETR
jgi:hypothetical protein